MSITHGKLVPKRLAGWSTGRRTMQDDDGIGGPIPAPPKNLVTEASDPLITEGGDYLVTET